jgi:hypothetical protein
MIEEFMYDFTPSPCPGVGHKGAHVGIARDPGPVLGEDPPAEGVLLAEPHSSHSRTFEPEVKATHPRKQTAHGQHSSRPP